MRIRRRYNSTFPHALSPFRDDVWVENTIGNRLSAVKYVIQLVTEFALQKQLLSADPLALEAANPERLVF